MPDDELPLENDLSAWQALRMVRGAIKAPGPPGALPSEEAVLELYGPKPIHEGQAIVDALMRLLEKRQ
jgi:hypothetical protein